MAVPLVVLVYAFSGTTAPVTQRSVASPPPFAAHGRVCRPTVRPASLRAYEAVPAVRGHSREDCCVQHGHVREANIKLWLLMRLNTAGSAITFFCIVAQVVTRGYISTSDLSIAILYAQLLPALLQAFLFQSSQLEAQMASGEVQTGGGEHAAGGADAKASAVHAGRGQGQGQGQGRGRGQDEERRSSFDALVPPGTGTGTGTGPRQGQRVLAGGAWC